MGNCLKIDSSDDISLLSGGSSGGGAGCLGVEVTASNTARYPAAGVSIANDSFIPAEAAFRFGSYQVVSDPMQPATSTTAVCNSVTTGHTIATSDSHNIYPCNLSKLEQVRLAKRIGLIQHLPIGIYDGCCDETDDADGVNSTNTNIETASPSKERKKKSRECVICMIEFTLKESIRYLPCMHAYHVRCIDDWLMRSLTCPSCMVPVDAALLISFDT